MTWYAAGLVWIIQIFFWGLGLTLLIVPSRWRRFWPAFCAPTGLALQSLVVWIGTHTSLPGTDSYAFASLIVPAVLLLAAWRRERGRGGIARLLTGAWRWWAVAGLMGASLSLQAYPFTKPPGVLTSAAVGSCDAADYATGARVFKEFSRLDRSGFLGNTDLAGSLPVDNFYDFWLRLNHFSPSAFIALHGSLCGRQPYELTSLFGIVLLTLGLPGVFWLARSAFRFGQAGSAGGHVDLRVQSDRVLRRVPDGAGSVDGGAGGCAPDLGGLAGVSRTEDLAAAGGVVRPAAGGKLAAVRRVQFLYLVCLHSVVCLRGTVDAAPARLVRARGDGRR